MFAQINHMAMISANYALLSKFYEGVFGLKSSGRTSPFNATVYGDGYVGLNIIPRRDGYVGGLDHFGMAGGDGETGLGRMRRKHPQGKVVEGPSTPPVAAHKGYDPHANVFHPAPKKD